MKADWWSVQVSSVAQFLSTFMSPTWIHEWIHSHFCPVSLVGATLRKIESDQVVFATAGATITTLWKAGGSRPFPLKSSKHKMHLFSFLWQSIPFDSNNFPPKKVTKLYKRTTPISVDLALLLAGQNCFRCPAKQLQIWKKFHLKMIRFW